MGDAREVRLLERHLCDDLLTLRLSRPADYHFAAGQYLVLEIDTPGGSERRTLSHASAPDDSDLQVMTRVSKSAFKQTLVAMQPGAEARLRGPGGRLRLSDSEPTVFLVGGVGITPVRSMMRDAMLRGVDLEAVLLFGNRDERCIPFRDELESYGMPRTRVLHVLERPDTAWTGETGLIGPELIRRHVEDPPRWRYVIAGPPAMVEAMGRCVATLGIDSERVTLERFGAPTRG